MLTNVTIYWLTEALALTETLASSTRIFGSSGHAG
jgi:hypothetical protein